MGMVGFLFLSFAACFAKVIMATKRATIVVAESNSARYRCFSEIPVQVLFAAMPVAALHAALE